MLVVVKHIWYITEIRETFDLFDSDRDGKVSTKEISVIMRSLGMLISDKELEELLARLDTDGRVRREQYACGGEGGGQKVGRIK